MCECVCLCVNVNAPTFIMVCDLLQNVYGYLVYTIAKRGSDVYAVIFLTIANHKFFCHVQNMICRRGHLRTRRKPLPCQKSLTTFSRALACIQTGPEVRETMTSHQQHLRPLGHQGRPSIDYSVVFKPASGHHLDTQTFKNHPFGQPNIFLKCQFQAKIYFFQLNTIPTT